jgi:hypothetical protein
MVVRNPNQPAARAAALVPYIAPMIRSAANSAIRSSLSSINWTNIGGAAAKLKNGYMSRSTSNRSAPLLESSSSVPVTISTRVTSRSARVKSGRGMKQPTVITHRELVNPSIAGSSTFTIQQSLALQPGLSSTFPWLSTQAIQYEEYRFRRLEFEYVPIAPTSTQGDLMLCPDYDSSNAPPLTEVVAVDHMGSVVDSVWKPITINLVTSDMHALGPRKYVRSQAMFGDIKTFDCGNLFLCTNNETSTAIIGKLFVSYTIELYGPTVGPPQNIPAANSVFYNTSSQAITKSTWTPIFATTTMQSNPLGITYGSSGTGIFTPPMGTYKIEYTITWNDSTSEDNLVQVGVYKNAVFVGAIVYSTSSILSRYYSASGMAVVSVNGTDAITLGVNMSGAAGALSTPASLSFITFSLA